MAIFTAFLTAFYTGRAYFMTFWGPERLPDLSSAAHHPGTTEPDPDLAFEVVRRSMEKGVLMFAPVGYGMATVKISPPLVITEEALEESLDVLEEAFSEALRETAVAAS